MNSNFFFVAAHCFWTKGLRRTTIPNEKNIFKTAVGKESSNFSVIDNTYTQIIDVSKQLIPINNKLTSMFAV